MNTKSPPFPASFLERQRRQLLALRAELLRTREAQVAEEKDIDSASSGRAREDEEDAQSLAIRELDDNLAGRATERLADVERALQKIDEGTYGVSDASGSPIPLERLEVVPEAIYTLAEQQSREPGG
ncbi:MAG: TraR/DksA family transcriptional regulator [Steroidobacteraceae bacterium]